MPSRREPEPLPQSEADILRHAHQAALNLRVSLDNMNVYAAQVKRDAAMLQEILGELVGQQLPLTGKIIQVGRETPDGKFQLVRSGEPGAAHINKRLRPDFYTIIGTSIPAPAAVFVQPANPQDELIYGLLQDSLEIFTSEQKLLTHQHAYDRHRANPNGLIG